MAIDFDAIRRKLNKLSGTSSRQNTMWRPQEGEETTIRLMSFPDNDGQPFKERWFYYNIGNNPGLLAPYQFGNPDPIQELINKLREEGSKESYELCKKLYPKMRSYAPVVVRGQEDKGVRLWSFGKTVYQSLLNIMLDEDYGDITDPVSGRDVSVEFKTAEETGASFPKTTIRVKPNQTPITEDKAQLEGLLDNQKDITELYQELSYEELTTVLNEWLNPEASKDEEEKETAPVSAVVAESTKVEDASAAFDDLFNK